jgi:hypothetical protein
LARAKTVFIGGKMIVDYAILSVSLIIMLLIGVYLGRCSMECWKHEALSKREIRGLPDMNLSIPCPDMKPPKQSSLEVK